MATAPPGRPAPRGARPLSARIRPLGSAVLLLFAGVLLAGQGAAPAVPLQLLARDVQRAVPTTIVGGQEYVALEDLSPPFQLSVREEAGGVTVTAGGRTIVLTPDQPLASIGGRLVSLPGAPIRSGRRWLVPLEFVSRALGPATGTTVDLRKASRLMVVGELRVPRVVTRTESSATQARVTIDVTPAAAMSVSQESGRLVVRVDADAIDPTIPATTASPVVDSVQRVAGQPAIAIQTGPRFASYRATTSTAEGGSRMTVDLLAQGAAMVPAPSVAAPGAPSPAPGTVLPPELVPPAGGLRAVAIDPGHGGADQGARGPAGTLEKDLTLDLARRLKTVLETRLGVRVVLTREDDRALGLDERAAIANNSRADLLVSLHANASLAGAARGAEIYYLAGGGSNIPGRAADSTPVPALGGATRTIDLVLWEQAQLTHLDESAALASAVEQSLRGRVGVASRAVRRAPLRVLVGANMPAIVVETGYLTSAEEEKQLASDEYRNALIQGLVEAIVRFRDRPGAPIPAAPSPDTAAPVRPPAPGGLR